MRTLKKELEAEWVATGRGDGPGVLLTALVEKYTAEEVRAIVDWPDGDPIVRFVETLRAKRGG